MADWKNRARPEQPWQTVILGTPEGITCPDCGMTSYHPADAAQGYCGNCHWWTSDPALAGTRGLDDERRHA
jgi:hypothetical protein